MITGAKCGNVANGVARSIDKDAVIEHIHFAPISFRFLLLFHSLSTIA